MGMHNKETYTRIYMRTCARIDIHVCTNMLYNTHMRSSGISELHCSFNNFVHVEAPRTSQKA